MLSVIVHSSVSLVYVKLGHGKVCISRSIVHARLLLSRVPGSHLGTWIRGGCHLEQNEIVSSLDIAINYYFEDT